LPKLWAIFPFPLKKSPSKKRPNDDNSPNLGALNIDMAKHASDNGICHWLIEINEKQRVYPDCQVFWYLAT